MTSQGTRTTAGFGSFRHWAAPNKTHWKHPLKATCRSMPGKNSHHSCTDELHPWRFVCGGHDLHWCCTIELKVVHYNDYYPPPLPHSQGLLVLSGRSFRQLSLVLTLVDICLFCKLQMLRLETFLTGLGLNTFEANHPANFAVAWLTVLFHSNLFLQAAGWGCCKCKADLHPPIRRSPHSLSYFSSLSQGMSSEVHGDKVKTQIALTT